MILLVWLIRYKITFSCTEYNKGQEIGQISARKTVKTENIKKILYVITFSLNPKVRFV